VAEITTNNTDKRTLRRWRRWLLSSICRETTSGQFIPVIDGLRFMAILSVVCCHLYTFVSRKNAADVDAGPLLALFSSGNVGVQLFFVISGFIIALPFAKGRLGLADSPQLRAYYLRRLTRLEPPYIVCLLISFPISVTVTHIAASELIPHLFASLGYLHNTVYGEMSAVNFVAWSLEVEFQFYIIAPLITCLFALRSRIVRRSVLGLLIALFSFISYSIGDSPRLSLSIVVMAQYFLTGFLLLDIYLADWGGTIPKSYHWDVVSVLSWVSIYALHHNGRSGDLFLAVPMFLAYYSAFRGVWSSYFFGKKAIYTIGGMCYTLYMYHYTIIFIVGRLAERAGLLAGLSPWLSIIAISVLAIPAILILCVPLFVFIEKPCMRRDWHVRVFERIKEWARGEFSCSLRKADAVRNDDF